MRNTVNDLNIYGQYVLGKLETISEPVNIKELIDKIKFLFEG
jgi:hypothetical protein